MGPNPSLQWVVSRNAPKPHIQKSRQGQRSRSPRRRTVVLVDVSDTDASDSDCSETSIEGPVVAKKIKQKKVRFIDDPVEKPANVDAHKEKEKKEGSPSGNECRSGCCKSHDEPKASIKDSGKSKKPYRAAACCHTNSEVIEEEKPKRCCHTSEKNIKAADVKVKSTSSQPYVCTDCRSGNKDTANTKQKTTDNNKSSSKKVDVIHDNKNSPRKGEPALHLRSSNQRDQNRPTTSRANTSEQLTFPNEQIRFFQSIYMAKRVLQPSRGEVVLREDVIECPSDPRPNAFFDTKTGVLRVYHGPIYGNPFATLIPLSSSMTVGTFATENIGGGPPIQPHQASQPHQNSNGGNFHQSNFQTQSQSPSQNQQQAGNQTSVPGAWVNESNQKVDDNWGNSGQAGWGAGDNSEWPGNQAGGNAQVDQTSGNNDWGGSSELQNSGDGNASTNNHVSWGNEQSGNNNSNWDNQATSTSNNSGESAACNKCAFCASHGGGNGDNQNQRSSGTFGGNSSPANNTSSWENNNTSGQKITTPGSSSKSGNQGCHHSNCNGCHHAQHNTTNTNSNWQSNNTPGNHQHNCPNCAQRWQDRHAGVNMINGQENQNPVNFSGGMQKPCCGGVGSCQNGPLHHNNNHQQQTNAIGSGWGNWAGYNGGGFAPQGVQPIIGGWSGPPVGNNLPNNNSGDSTWGNGGASKPLTGW